MAEREGTMAIIYQHENHLFTLNTAHTTYQMKVDDLGFLLHLYYGEKLSGNIDYLLPFYDRGFSGNPFDAENDRTYSLDVLPQEYPTMGTGDYRNYALLIKNADHSECCDLRYQSHKIKQGKYNLPGLPAVYASDQEAETLEILMEDPVSHVQVFLFYGVLEKEDIITRSAKIINNGTEQIVIEKASSCCLDFLSGDYDLLSFYGKHEMERQLQRTEINHGSHVIGSRRGTSSHQYNPAIILAEKNTTEDYGTCYGIVFVYSGNFLCEVEKDPFNQTRVLMGLHSDSFHYSLKSKESLLIPETIISFSTKGFGQLSRQYHHCIRKHLCRKTDHLHHSILINSWEAAYFHFNGETICQLAADAAELGMDMVVMDDGWFGKREDDNSGLGDWEVNEEKLGCSLAEIIKKVNQLGIKFGIWIEPEMVSEDSILYRKHPDWILHIPKRNPIRGRNQLVLDFSREEVRTYIFDQICKILDQGNIEYIKWDMNRSISEFYSMETNQGNISYDYVLGVYDFLEKLVQRYPNTLIEGCSGGGGRFDAGMMYYTPQIWCSDNTDALDRIFIQYGTSFFYPISTIGSHVSDVPNHQTGRNISLHTRGIVAMAGTFGYELNPAKLEAEEKKEIKEQIKLYKHYERLIRYGDYYRLSNPFQDPYAAWMFLSQDESQILLNLVMLEIHGNMPVHYVKLKGLQADALYADTKTGKTYYGSALMYAGLPIPIEKIEFPSYQIELKKKLK